MRNRLTALAFAGILLMSVTASPAIVAGDLPRRNLGKIDQRYAWVPKDNPVPAIDACAAKAKEQTCLMQTMRDAGASNEALAFTRWYYYASNGDSAFITHVRAARDGPVSIASIELPARANDNFVFFFVNGTPALVDPNEIFRVEPWHENKIFSAIKKAHPDANVFPDQAFVREGKTPQGRQRYTIAFPIVDGCHACNRLAIAYVGYEFGPDGVAGKPFVTAIHECPSADKRCESFVTDAGI